MQMILWKIVLDLWYMYMLEFTKLISIIINEDYSKSKIKLHDLIQITWVKKIDNSIFHLFYRFLAVVEDCCGLTLMIQMSTDVQHQA